MILSRIIVFVFLFFIFFNILLEFSNVTSCFMWRLVRWLSNRFQFCTLLKRVIPRSVWKNSASLRRFSFTNFVFVLVLKLLYSTCFFASHPNEKRRRNCILCIYSLITKSSFWSFVRIFLFNSFLTKSY